jgi:hypothetical protein
VKESDHIPGDQRASGYDRTRPSDKVAELGVKRTMYCDGGEMENYTSVTCSVGCEWLLSQFCFFVVHSIRVKGKKEVKLRGSGNYL